MDNKVHIRMAVNIMFGRKQQIRFHLKMKTAWEETRYYMVLKTKRIINNTTQCCRIVDAG